MEMKLKPKSQHLPNLADLYHPQKQHLRFIPTMLRVTGRVQAHHLRVV